MPTANDKFDDTSYLVDECFDFSILPSSSCWHLTPELLDHLLNVQLFCNHFIIVTSNSLSILLSITHYYLYLVWNSAYLANLHTFTCICIIWHEWMREIAARAWSQLSTNKKLTLKWLLTRCQENPLFCRRCEDIRW